VRAAPPCRPRGPAAASCQPSPVGPLLASHGLLLCAALLSRVLGCCLLRAVVPSLLVAASTGFSWHLFALSIYTHSLAAGFLGL
jgi:hypothetical protein